MDKGTNLIDAKLKAAKMSPRVKPNTKPIMFGILLKVQRCNHYTLTVSGTSESRLELSSQY